MDGKKGASGIIADAFKSCRSRLKVLRKSEQSNNARPEEIPESDWVSGSEETPSIWLNQAALFDCFRGLLDAIYGWPQEDSGAGKIVDMHSDYLRPSYAAKFWLNRYLRLTKQDNLPKRTAVRNLVVIHRRCDPGSPVGRLINDPTLMYTVNAIKCANVRAEQAGEAPFSHIIL
jgi:hypothetical protein